MWRLIFFFLLSLVSMVGSAQQDTKQIDSLKALVDYQNPDTNSVLQLIKIERLYSRAFETDSLFKYAEEAIRFAERLDYSYGLARGYSDIAIMQWNMGELDSALKNCEFARNLFLSIDDSLRFTNQSFLYGMILSDYGRYDEALKNHLQCLRYFEKRNSPSAINVYNSIGYVQKNLGNTDLAIDAYQQSLKLAQKYEDKEQQANASSNLGDLYLELEKIDEAMTLFKRALKIDEELGLEWGVGFQLVNIGNAYALKEEYATALEYQLRGLEIRRKIGQKVHLGTNLMVVGNAYRKWGKPAQSLPYLIEAKEILEEINSLDFLKSVMYYLGCSYADLGRFEEAYQASERSRIIDDSLYYKEKTQIAEELNAQYESEKKANEIKLLTTKNQLKETALQNAAFQRYGLVLGLILLSVIGLIVWRSQQKKLQSQQLLAQKNEALKASEFKQSLTELELKALRAQMNPHFIFNCMNSINRLILAGENEKAARNLTKFSRLIRMILEFSERKTISLREELDMLETYIQLESQRYKGKISYDIKLADNVDAEEVEVPSMVLQPFIENAIWHGLMHKDSGDGMLRIFLEERGDLLHCTIEDNGVGREKALALIDKSAVSHKSMAIKLTRERLKLLNSSGLQKLIQIVDLKDAAQKAIGTRVELSIPL